MMCNIFIYYYYFIKMENISKFLDGCEQLGVAKTDSFQTVDLYEGQNVPQVYNCWIHVPQVSTKFSDF